VVECAGFENRSARKGSGSSNLPLSVSFHFRSLKGLAFGALNRCRAVLFNSWTQTFNPFLGSRYRHP
jgi:hypothetical protein